LDKWKDAIQLEYNALIENQMWESVDWKSIPNGVSIHKPIWRFKIKEDGRYKAHLCFDGQFQETGVLIHLHQLCNWRYSELLSI
jgi:hypothetical protein